MSHPSRFLANFGDLKSDEERKADLILEKVTKLSGSKDVRDKARAHKSARKTNAPAVALVNSRKKNLKAKIGRHVFSKSKQNSSKTDKVRASFQGTFYSPFG